MQRSCATQPPLSRALPLRVGAARRLAAAPSPPPHAELRARAAAPPQLRRAARAAACAAMNGDAEEEEVPGACSARDERTHTHSVARHVGSAGPTKATIQRCSSLSLLAAALLR
jgi:hypothetical protein